jgi:tRNA-splicing ligase RtcB
MSNSTLVGAKEQLGIPGLIGNHFIELQQVKTIYNNNFSEAFGLKKDDYFLLIHLDSKDLNLKLENSFRKNKFLVLDENSKRAKRFHNISMFMEKYCSLNRLVIADTIVKAIEEVIPVKAELLYDSTHESLNNLEVDGEILWRHHAGVAFANAKGSKKIFKKFRSVGQPIFLPGGMGAENYILASQNTKTIFESINHGAGRSVPKSEAREKFKNINITDTFVKKNVILRQLTNRELISQFSLSYKSIDLIDDLVVNEGFAKNVAKTQASIILKG